MLEYKEKRKIKLLFFLKVLMIMGMASFAQENQISLDDAIQLANQSSLDAFKAKRQYAIDYWKYKSFKAQFLPRVDFSFNPFTYNRTLIQRYDPDNNVDVYRPQQNLNSFSELSISQNIISTGTKIFVNSNFNRLVNFSDTRIENYSTTPIQVGLSQPLMAFNELKWQNKTALLEFEKAKKEYIFSQQDINLRTVELFFQWALNNKKVEIAEETKTNAEKLYEIAKRRYDIGAIEKDELLNPSELSKTFNKNTIDHV